jgi:hypothetical protein
VGAGGERVNVRRLLAEGFERAVFFAQPRPGCRVTLEPDPFDGRVYTIDAFYAAMQPFFDRPDAFFRDFLDGRALALRADGPARDGRRRYVFDSPVESRFEANARVPLTWFSAPRPARSALVLVPGWSRPDQRLEERWCRIIAAHGIDVVLLTVPYHLERAPRGSWSGEYFISHNVFWTVANFRQLVAEIRAVVRMLRSDHDAVGLVGISSGGFQAGLATLGEPVDAIFPIMSGAQLGAITWESLLTRTIKRRLTERGVDRDALSRAWAITDMDVVGRHSRARLRKQYVTLYDAIMPPPYQERLWEVYGRPQRIDVQASHYSVIFSFRHIADDIARTMIDGIDNRTD